MNEKEIKTGQKIICIKECRVPAPNRGTKYDDVIEEGKYKIIKGMSGKFIPIGKKSSYQKKRYYDSQVRIVSEDGMSFHYDIPVMKEFWDCFVIDIKQQRKDKLNKLNNSLKK